MTWIKSEDTIWEHHKLKKLKMLTGTSDVKLVGHLHSLWHFTLRNAWRDANLEPWGILGIAEAARWDGDPDQFVTALRESAFLDQWVVHDWIKRAGKLVKDRRYAEKRRRVADKKRLSVARGRVEKSRVDESRVQQTSFEAFWTNYPKKVGRLKAWKLWRKIDPAPPLAARILAALAAQAASPQWQKEDGEFIPHAATWLNGRRWEDETKTSVGRDNGIMIRGERYEVA